MLLNEIFGTRQLIDEMAIAQEGDWRDNIPSLGFVSEFIVEHKYEALTIFKVGDYRFSLIKSKINDDYKIGEFIEDQTNSHNPDRKFRVLVECSLSDIEIPNIVIPNLKKVDEIQVVNSFQGKGLATQLYKYFVKQLNIVLMGDLEQFFGARRLWATLSKELDVQVDIIDVKQGKYVERHVVLHHGKYDYNFDARVWSYHTDLAHIRLILTNVFL